MSIRKKVVSILKMLIPLMFLFIGCHEYDEYEPISKLSDELYNAFNSASQKDYVPLLKEYGIDMKHKGLYIVTRDSFFVEFKDPPALMYLDNDVMLVNTGPLSIASGWRFILSPKFSELRVIKTENLKLLKIYKIKGFVENAMLWRNMLIFSFKNGEFGKIKYDPGS